MNVKLQIKEVKEETRELTVFEEALVMAVQPQTICPYYPQFVDRCKNKLRELGLSEHVDDYMGGYGKPFIWTFRTETIRDATPEEVIAWQCIVSYNHCMTAPGLSVCSKSPGGYCCGWFCYHDRLKSYKLLRGKEVILSLIEGSI